MNKIIHEKNGHHFHHHLAEARKHPAFHEAALLHAIARRVIEAMEVRDVSRTELARRMDVSPAYVTKILRGHANLSLESLAKLAFALDLQWECFLVPQNSRINFFALKTEKGETLLRSDASTPLQNFYGVPLQPTEAVNETPATYAAAKTKTPRKR